MLSPLFHALVEAPQPFRLPDTVSHHTHTDRKIVRAIPVHNRAEIIINQECTALHVIRCDQPTAQAGMRQR